MLVKQKLFEGRKSQPRREREMSGQRTVGKSSFFFIALKVKLNETKIKRRKKKSADAGVYRLA